MIRDEQINTALELLRDELVENLDFLTKVIKNDREKMQRYFREFGDLYPRQRKMDGDGYSEEPISDRAMEPLASQFRTSIKSLLDSVSVIENKLNNDPTIKGAADSTEIEDIVLDVPEIDITKSFKDAAKKGL